MNLFELAETKDDRMQAVNEYLGMWRDQEGFSDINLMLDKGLTELAAVTLLEAGAIDSQICFNWAKPIEQYIERLCKKYTKKQRKADLKEFWQDTVCWIDESNEHYFIHPDHFIKDSELREWGFKPSKEVK